jgi:hypothetical protein
MAAVATRETRRGAAGQRRSGSGDRVDPEAQRCGGCVDLSGDCSVGKRDSGIRHPQAGVSGRRRPCRWDPACTRSGKGQGRRVACRGKGRRRTREARELGGGEA